MGYSFLYHKIPFPSLDEDQFADYTDECYVAAWGSDPFIQPGQREVHLPLMSRQECNQRLEPEFSSRGVKGWVMKQSEICAGKFFFSSNKKCNIAFAFEEKKTPGA